MKMPTIAADDVALGARIEPASAPATTSMLDRIRGAFAALNTAHAQWALRAELAALDDHVLRDIGIDQDELPRVRTREHFTPRAWRV